MSLQRFLYLVFLPTDEQATDKANEVSNPEGIQSKNGLKNVGVFVYFRYLKALTIRLF